MRDITLVDAASNHGITTLHQEMDNGQYRFRLLKSDGTAYIRTESMLRGAWESSHYHAHVKETYIVQRGWIAYAQLIENQRRIRIFRAGELFTTDSCVVHNIYMPLGSVIHVIKHGDTKTKDRIQDETTRHFDTITEPLIEGEIMQEAAKSDEVNLISKPEEAYSSEYRHFDTLIWQLPAWCTAIFMVTAVGTNSIEQAHFLTRATTLTTGALATGFLGIMFLVIFGLSHALYRFRSHQAMLKKGYPRTPVWASASTYLQLVVTMEAFSLLFLVLMLVGTASNISLWTCLILIALLTVYREIMVRHAAATGRKTIS